VLSSLFGFVLSSEWPSPEERVSAVTTRTRRSIRLVDVKRERDWGDWFASLNDLGDKAELTLGAVLVAALSAMGCGCSSEHRPSLQHLSESWSARSRSPPYGSEPADAASRCGLTSSAEVAIHRTRIRHYRAWQSRPSLPKHRTSYSEPSRRAVVRPE
jgi:hypothetical protein